MKRILAAIVLASFMSGCFMFSNNNQPSSNKCNSDAECKDNKVCVQGVCQTKVKGKATNRRR